MPMADLVSRATQVIQNAEFTQTAYVASLAQEVLVMLHDIFKQELLEVLLECFTDLNPEDVSLYDQFCDRIEQGMSPHIATDQETSIDQTNAENQNIELKIPFLAKIIDQERKSKVVQSEQGELIINHEYVE